MRYFRRLDYFTVVVVIFGFVVVVVIGFVVVVLLFKKLPNSKHCTLFSSANSFAYNEFPFNMTYWGHHC